MSNLFENWELEVDGESLSARSYKAPSPSYPNPGRRPVSASSSSPSFNPFASPSSSNPFASPALSQSSYNPFAVAASRPVSAGDAKESFATQKFSRKESTAVDTINETIFRIRKSSLDSVFSRKSPSWSILCVATSQSAVLLGSNDCKVIRWNPRGGEKAGSDFPSEIEISKSQDDGIRSLHVDPTGNHVIVVLHGGETHYLHRTSVKPRKLTKWAEIKIECVAFDRRRCSESSSMLLIGTSSGEIFEATLDNSGKDKVPTLLYVLKDDQPLSSLILETTLFSVHKEPRLLVLAATATPTRLYTFVGGPTLELLFRSYREIGAAPFQELPGRVPTMRLNCFYASIIEQSESSTASQSTKSRKTPSNVNAPLPNLDTFAMLTADGIYHGKITFPGNANGGLNIDDFSVNNTQLLSYPGAGIPPLSLAITQHHFLLLYRDRLVTVSKLTGQEVEEVSLDIHIGHPLSLGGLFDTQTDSNIKVNTKSPDSCGLYIFTDKNMLEIVAIDESRDIWNAYLDRAINGDDSAFETAISHCPGPVEEAHVRCEKANKFYKHGNFSDAALEYALTNAPFEEVSLNFNEANQEEALRIYLSQKLDTLDPFAQKAQCTMISTWLVELYLRALNFSSTDTENSEEISLEFRNFLENNCAYLNPATTSSLLTSHGRKKDLLFFANLTEDFDTILSHHLSHNGVRGPDYISALSVLENAPIEKVEGLIYRYSSVLMDADPAGTVHLWKGKVGLRATKLMPALVRYNQNRNKSDKQNWAVTYLEFCINTLHLKDAAIHNHLVAVYAKIEYDQEIEANALNTTSDSSTNSSALLDLLTRDKRCYDVAYALRVCMQYERKHACVYIYSAMNLYEEAVDLALTIDLDLAKKHSNLPKDDDIRKRLWLKVIKNAIQESSDASVAMSLLNECDLIRMEDILPYFPDFAVIDSFKADICTSLESYNKRIENLRLEMDEYTASTEATQSEINNLDSRNFYISSSQVCELCDVPILAHEFYYFPCNHGFHSHCLQVHMKNHLSPEQREAVEKLLGKLRELEQIKDRNKRLALQISTIQFEIDGYIAAECIFCGDVMISNIDKPLVSSLDVEESSSWILQ